MFLLRFNQFLGLLFLCAIGFACGQYGPDLAKQANNLYHAPKRDREANANYLMQYVSTKEIEINDEMKRLIDSLQAEFDANRLLGETYRMPLPRRP